MEIEILNIVFQIILFSTAKNHDNSDPVKITKIKPNADFS